jgi:hypothetical protein
MIGYSSGMRNILSSALFCLFASVMPVAAEGLPVPPTNGVIISAEGRTIVSSTLCAKLRAAVPSAAYRPGVDVNGAPVAPADLPPAGGGESVPIEVKIDLRRHLGADAKALGGRMVMGVMVLRDGGAYFNGEAISASEKSAVIAACDRAKR